MNHTKSAFITSVFLSGLIWILTDSIAGAYNWKSYNGHFYSLTENYGTWTEAEAEAISVGGHLVKIDDQLENDWITANLTSGIGSRNTPGVSDNLAWIGLQRTGPNGDDPSAWQWTDGTTPSFFNASNFDSDGTYMYLHGIDHAARGTWNAHDLHNDNYNNNPYGIIELTLPTDDDLPQQTPEAVVNHSLPDTNNLVLYTHGCCTTNEGFNSNNEFIRFADFKNALKGAVGADWGVYGHNWTDKSGSPELINELNVENVAKLGGVLLKAEQEGLKLGQAIAAEGYQHVHLIGHSAGSVLIEDAARAIEAISGGAIDTHTTFLDPFAPWPLNTLLGYGLGADWSDHYYAVDNGAPFTQEKLKNAHNVDVTRLDPNVNSELISDHVWPYEYYLRSIRSPDDEIPGEYEYPNVGYQGYGFARSKEGGGWDDRGDYEVGKDAVILSEGPAAESDNYFLRADSAQDISNTPHAKSDNVGVVDSMLDMQTASPAWISILIDVPDEINFITFDYEFLSAEGAEGLLAMYWDGDVISTIDERYALPGISTYTMWLPDIFLPGTYNLSFRLDPHTEIQSRATIDNIQTGLLKVIPEPSAMLLCGLASFLCLGFSRHR